MLLAVFSGSVPDAPVPVRVAVQHVLRGNPPEWSHRGRTSDGPGQPHDGVCACSSCHVLTGLRYKVPVLAMGSQPETIVCHAFLLVVLEGFNQDDGLWDTQHALKTTTYLHWLGEISCMGASCPQQPPTIRCAGLKVVLQICRGIPMSDISMSNASTEYPPPPRGCFPDVFVVARLAQNAQFSLASSVVGRNRTPS